MIFRSACRVPLAPICNPYTLEWRHRRPSTGHPPTLYSTPAPTAAAAAPQDRASYTETTAAAPPVPMTCTTTVHQTAANTAPRELTRLTPS